MIHDEEDVLFDRRRKQRIEALARLLSENKEHDLVQVFLDLTVLLIHEHRSTNDDAIGEAVFRTQGAIAALKELRARIKQARTESAGDGGSPNLDSLSGY